jgi:hypothetical protein
MVIADLDVIQLDFRGMRNSFMLWVPRLSSCYLHSVSTSYFLHTRTILHVTECTFSRQQLLHTYVGYCSWLCVAERRTNA